MGRDRDRDSGAYRGRRPGPAAGAAVGARATRGRVCVRVGGAGGGVGQVRSAIEAWNVRQRDAGARIELRRGSLLTVYVDRSVSYSSSND